MTSKNDDDIIIASKCFCGRNLYIGKSNTVTCGSSDCDLLAKKFGTVSNWLVINVKEIGKGNQDIILSIIESKIVKYLNQTKTGVSQKNIASETGLAKSTVSRTLISLINKKIVTKNYDFFAPKGKNISLFSLDI